MRDVRRARLATLGCVLAAGLVLAACGGGSNHSAGASNAPTSTTAPSGPGGASGPGAALTAFRTCMSDHGVTIATRPRGAGGPPSTTPGDTRPPRPDGGLGFGGGNFANRFNTPPAGVDPTKYKNALAACRSKLPTFNGGGALNSTAFQAYRSCLSDHGVKLPTTGGFGNINRNDPKVQTALKTCQPLLPAGFGRRGTTTTTTAAPA